MGRCSNTLGVVECADFAKIASKESGLYELCTLLVLTDLPMEEARAAKNGITKGLVVLSRFGNEGKGNPLLTLVPRWSWFIAYLILRRVRFKFATYVIYIATEVLVRLKFWAAG